jgi:hypothetical protein
MSNKKYTIIEIVADYIYFVITGSQNEIEDYCKILSKKQPAYEFISMRIDIPISFAIETLENKYGPITIENGSESAQSYAFAQESYIIKNKNDLFESMFNTKRSHMLMVLENNSDNEKSKKIRFPKLELHDQDDPEEVVLEWVKESSGYISKSLKKTIKPISIVGYNDDILVYTAKI